MANDYTVIRVKEWHAEKMLAFKDWNKVFNTVQSVIQTLTPAMDEKEDTRKHLLRQSMSDQLTPEQHHQLAQALKLRCFCPVEKPTASESPDPFGQMSFDYLWAISEFQAMLSVQDLIVTQTRNPLLQFVPAFDQNHRNALIAAARDVVTLRGVFQTAQDSIKEFPFDHSVLVEQADTLQRLSAEDVIRARDWSMLFIAQARSSLEAIRLARWIAVLDPEMESLIANRLRTTSTSEIEFSRFHRRETWWQQFKKANLGGESYCKERLAYWMNADIMRVDPSKPKKGMIQFRLSFLNEQRVDEPK